MKIFGREFFARTPSAPKTKRREFAFAGAQSNRLTLDWGRAPIASADKEQKADLKTLRARGREVVRNSAVGSRYVAILEQMVIGGGIKLQAKHQKAGSKDLDTTANQAIEDAFAKWSEPETCTLAGRHSFTEALGLAVRTWATDGEFFCELVEGKAAGNEWGFALNIIDADLLDEQLERPASPGKNEIRQGVEVDSYGKPVNYWFLEKHPNDNANHSGATAKRIARPIPASRVVHLFSSRRARQTRGTSWFAPVLMDLRMYAGYVEAELVAARVASAKMGAIQPSQEIGDVTADSAPETTQQQIEADPGSFFRLQPGETLAQFDPQHPTSAFRAFTIGVLHHIASGLGISYGTLTGDLSQANYSSMRVGQLTERDFWKQVQSQIITHFCKRVYRAWLRNALLSDQLTGLNSFDANRWNRVQWIPRGYPWVDPEKDLKAKKIELGLALTTRSRIAAENGDDLAELLAEKKQEAEMFEAAGIKLPPDLALLSEGASSAVAQAQNPAPEDAPADDAGRSVRQLKAV